MTSIPRPEHPRPLLERKEWLNLNGEWQFAFDKSNIGQRGKWQERKQLERTIVVPFAYQTEASTINDKNIYEVIWYSRSFNVPKKWDGNNILLHFGAVDYRSTVWINGNEVGFNQGGHVPFSFDITPFLIEGENQVSIRVEDYQDARQPRGKQSLSGEPHDIDYYCTTGIWQTVWLEAVPVMRIDDIRIVPSAAEKKFTVTAVLHAPSAAWKLEAEILENTTSIKKVAKEDHKAVITIEIPVPDAKLWTPAQPHLYTLAFKLYGEDGLCDEVLSYGGLRDVEISKDHLMLNGEPLYLAMALDQGYWPEGGMTAPGDDALQEDIVLAKKLGFNGVRKHQKVEDPRWLYWCDRLGLLVWGEMANAREWSHIAEEWFLAEWQRVIQRDFNHPCIITWVPLNESWGVPGLRHEHHIQYAFVERITTTTRRMDATRPVIDNDGWEHTNIGDICAIHDYTPTADGLRKRYKDILSGHGLPEKVWIGDVPLYASKSNYHGQPIIFTEVGGYLMLPADKSTGELDQLYSEYGNAKNNEDLMAKYADLCDGLMAMTFISGFCYTQLTDIEHEVNGILTYDRRPKLPIAEVADLNNKLIDNYARRHSV